MLTTLLRAGIGRTIKPFVFESTGHTAALDLDVPALGAYVHIPFCESLCPFCPYYKVPYAGGEAMESYLDAVEGEIAAVLGGGERRTLTSLYFGGGSPALAGASIARVIAAVRACADISGGIGVELHPRDVTGETVTALAEAGMTMASLGVQSFRPAMLAALGRAGDPDDAERALAVLGSAGLDAVDVDLIFGIPGQSDEDLARDFERAVELGATQVSTYPFIDFTYAENRHPPVPERRKRELLAVLLATAEACGFERSSVWTFRRAGTPAYSSITRDNFVGFGASATTLLRDEFKVNAFSVAAYSEAVAAGRPATAYTLRFTTRTRQAYWLFWACYGMEIGRERFRTLFGRDLDAVFGGWLAAARLAGIAERTGRGWRLTARGAYLYHIVEQVYTHQYIDKTWAAAMAPDPPERIVLW
ncbi:MAG: radical SAM protein [Actinomycetota bacterium]|nr:radical SAM protein [Actinomycetota bacterium]